METKLMKHLHLPLLFSLPVLAHAHTGLEARHGEDGALAYWLHVLTEPDHLAMLLGSVALLGVVAYRSWRTRQQSRNATLDKDRHDSR